MQKGSNTGDNQPLIPPSGQSPAKAAATPPALPPKKPGLAPKKAGAVKQPTSAPAPTTRDSQKAARKSLDVDDLPTETELTSKPLLDSPPSSPPAPLRQASWTKSPRGSSDAPARSSLFSTRTKTSIPPVRSDVKTDQAENTTPVIDPVAHVMHYQTMLTERMKTLGSKPAPYEKAIAQINAVLSEDYFAKLTSPAIMSLRAMMPNLSQKSPTESVSNSPYHDTTDSDTHSPHKTSTESHTEFQEKPSSQSISASSPEEDTSSSTIPPKELEVNQLHRTSDEASQSPESQKNKITSSSNDNSPEKAKTDFNYSDQQVILTLIPISDLFDDTEKLKIIDEKVLEIHHPSLAILNTIISKVEHLRGQFTNQERLFTPLTTLRDYYQEHRAQILNAKDMKERIDILAGDAVFVSSCLNDYFVLDKGKHRESRIKALELLCCDENGITHKTNEFGNRAGGAHNGMWIKKDPPAGPHLKPPVEMAIGSWYQLFDQRDMNAAPSAVMKVLHAQIIPSEISKIYDSSAATMTYYYNQNAHVQRTLQCGFLVEDSEDLQLVIEASTVFIHWQDGLKENLLLTLHQIEALFKANPESIEKLELWPQTLIQHSGCKGAEISRIPKLFKVMRNVIGKDSPEILLREMPTMCDQLDHYHFSAFFIANLGIDPTDLSGGNVRFAWRTRDDGSRIYRLVCIDADEALDFPVHLINDTHQNSVKNITLLMRRNTQKPIDQNFRAEFLSRSPLSWLLHWFQLIYPQDQTFRKLVAEKAVDKIDLYEDDNNPLLSKEFKDRHKAELLARIEKATTRREVIPTKQSSALEITMPLHPERLPSMLQTLEKLQRAMEKDPKITLEECARVARPATALHYESVGYPLLNDNNFPESLMVAYITTACRAPSFEEHFLKDKITPLVQQRLGDKFKPQFMNSLTKYQKLLEEQEQQLNAQQAEKAEKSKSKKEKNADALLPSLEELTKDCPVPEYCGKSLYDLLSSHTHSKEDYQKQATLSVSEAIKLLFKHIDFNIYIPKRIPELLEILNTVGNHLPFVEIKKLEPTQINELASLATEAALTGAVTLLSKNFADFSAVNKEGNTPLHVLLRSHQKHSKEKVLATLEVCLASATCDPELCDAEQRTPLMTFIDFMDVKNQAFAESVFTVLRQHKVNLNLRTSFVRKNKLASKEAGTALDFAIDRESVSAFIILLNQGAGDCVDINAALQFIKKYTGNPEFDKAVELLKIRHPELAYEIYLEQITTAKPDKEHPESCKIIGAEHRERYLLQTVWDQLFDKKGEIFNKNSVAAGAHIVIPIKIPNNPDPILFSKFYPEFPGLQRLAEIILFALSCPTTRSELWRVNLNEGKNAIPVQLSTAIKGDSLLDVLTNPAKFEEFKAKLDLHHFSLLSTILDLLGQEDGHADQFKVVRIPTPDGEKMIVVPVDLERIFVSAFLHDGKEKILLLKDIILLLPQFRNQPLTPQAIATMISANGKRLPNKMLNPQEAELLIRENANRLFDRLTGYMQLIEKQHLTLFPRDEKVWGDNVNSGTLTGAEMFDENLRKPFATRFGNVMDKYESAEERQANKTKSAEEKKRGQSLLQKAKEKVKDRLGLTSNITIIGCPVEKRTPSVLHQRFIHIARILHMKAGIPMTGMMLLRFIRPDVYPLYHGVVTANPKMNPCEHYKVLTEGLTDQKSKTDMVPRTLSKQMDVLVCVSQPVSTKFRSEGVCVTARVAAEFYLQTKSVATLKAIAVHEISSGDTTKLQACKTEEEFESFVNSLIWKQGGKDNRAVLNTILSIQSENGFWFRTLRLVNCKELTWKDLTKILEQSPTLETLDLTGSSGLQAALNTNNLFKLLADYCPSLTKLIINETEITTTEINWKFLPSLSHFEAKKCLLLKSCSFINASLQHLDISESNNCETLEFEYTADQALRRPLEEERPLKVFNVSGCTQLKGDDITGVLDRSPFLTDFIHGGNQKFNARSFAWFAFKQGRFNRRIFESMIQNGVLNLYGLPFEDKHLAKFQEWLGAANAPKVSEVNFRGCSFLTRLAMFEFVVKQESILKVVYGGPVRGIRQCGGVREWDIGLKNPITTIKTLSNGGIIAFSKRVAPNPRILGAVEYNVRMPDDKAKDHSQSSYVKDANAKHTVKPRTLIPGCDLRGVTEMMDGSLLISLEENASNLYRSSHLLILDPITDQRQILDVPEVNSLAGNLCMINPTTFALHSDRFYIIQKNEFGWRIKYTAEGRGRDGLLAPVTNNKDLVAYFTSGDTNRRLCVMNIHTGELVVNQRFQEGFVIPLLFLDETRLVFFNGTFYSVLNLSTQEIHVLEKHKDSVIAHTTLAWANFLPTGELLLGGANTSYGEGLTETFDPVTLQRITYNEAHKIINYQIAHHGDPIFLIDNGELRHHPKRFFVIDLSFRQQPQRGYECLPVERGNSTVQILTPETVVPNSINIDDIGGNVPWAITMFSGKPTSRTLYDMLCAFFENYDEYRDEEGQKPVVTHQDMTITITGLSDQECTRLPALLNLLWNKTPSMAPRQYTSLFYAQNPLLSAPKPSSLVAHSDEEALEEINPSATVLN